MALKINSNIPSLSAVNQAGKTRETLVNSLERIASGRKINAASDDASGMAIANSLKSRAMAAGQEIENAGNTIAITQIADGALGQMTDILQEMRTRAVAATSGIHSADSLSAIQSDITASMAVLEDISGTTSYNGQTLLDGTFELDGSVIPSAAPGQLGSAESGILSQIDVTTADGAAQALETLDAALAQIGQTRSDLGATQNQFTSEINNLSNTRINLMAAESQIRDTDLAEESVILNQAKILNQASTYALAQANKSKQHLIDLIG